MNILSIKVICREIIEGSRGGTNRSSILECRYGVNCFVDTTCTGTTQTFHFCFPVNRPIILIYSCHAYLAWFQASSVEYPCIVLANTFLLQTNALSKMLSFEALEFEVQILHWNHKKMRSVTHGICTQICPLNIFLFKV